MGYKSAKRRSKNIKWFGMELDPGAAQVLYIFAILALLGSIIWGLLLIMGVFNYLSAMAYYQHTQEAAQSLGYATGGYYIGASLMMYILYFFIWAFVLIIALYTINKCKPSNR